MIVTLKKGTGDDQMNEFIAGWKERGFGVHISKGENVTILGLVGGFHLLINLQTAHFTRMIP